MRGFRNGNNDVKNVDNLTERVTTMHAFQQRLAELWTLSKQRSLTDQEQKEFDLCLDANASYAWKLVNLENMSLMASMTRDYDWLHEICQHIERLQPRR